MLKNYFRVAIRNMMKRKWYSLLNIFGLATGMAVCLLIILFVANELSFDQFHEKKDRIYRVALERKYPGRSTSYAIIPASIGEAIQKEFPEVEQSVRIINGVGDQLLFVRIDDKVFDEKNVLFADSNFFNVFTVPLLTGNPEKALVQPNSVVLNEKTAKKYFGSTSNAIGKTLKADQNSWIVTAVCKDLPENSHFTFDLLVSTTTLREFLQDPNYINFSSCTYLLLHPQADAAALEAKLPQIVEKYVSPVIEKNFGVTFKQFQAEGNGYHYFLQPLKKIHLTSNLESELRPNGSIKIIYAFSVIALFILFLACINFINLSTARSLDRAKEVGIRKTFGSERSALIRQFLFESVIIGSLSMILSLGFVTILVPLFNNLFGTQLSVLILFRPIPASIIIVGTVLVGVLAGLYPAFVLSSFRPIVVLKGKFIFNPGGKLVRNSLVVFQFAISVVLIIATLIVNRQMQYMLSDQLGFHKNHIIIIKRADLLDKQSLSFKNELAKITGVESVTGTSAMPGEQNFFGISFNTVGSNESLTGRGIIADDQFLSTLDIPLVKGRYFSKDMATDSSSLVLNEKAASELGSQDPLGTRVTVPDDVFNLPGGQQNIYTVVGVVKDFHFQSLHQMITPLIFINDAKFRNIDNVIAVRIQASQFKSATSAIEKLWEQYVPQHPFYYSFLDQQLANLYQSEEKTQRLFTIFSLIAIFIAAMGLLGLVTYATQKRSREISIRKVLGASMASIIALLSKDFLRLVLIAVVMAFPVGWLFMNKWLQDFAYRINIGWWVFGASAFTILFIALMTVCIQAVKAAMANPVRALRSE